MNTEDKKIIKVKAKDGSMKEAEVILFFRMDGKKFVIYTYNEINVDGMIVLYSSMLEEDGDTVKLQKINPEDWTRVKGLMSKIAKEWHE